MLTKIQMKQIILSPMQKGWSCHDNWWWPSKSNTIYSLKISYRGPKPDFMARLHLLHPQLCKLPIEMILQRINVNTNYLANNICQKVQEPKNNCRNKNNWIPNQSWDLHGFFSAQKYLKFSVELFTSLPCSLMPS